MENMENMENIENMENMGNMGNMRNIGNTGNTGNIGNMGNMGSSQEATVFRIAYSQFDNKSRAQKRMPIKSKLLLGILNMPLITCNSVSERYAVGMVD